ncbi:MAG: hypothetical protein SR3Q1_10100 [Quinella sp. 3Q1]|nr:hypothetical protein [Quinella sp. 3Q1]MBR3050537.1 hypothetical protein [Selenomonadaceae bacterium]MBR6888416.1 hypothetical protein [Selenomonadaceae bacterium]
MLYRCIGIKRHSKRPRFEKVDSFSATAIPYHFLEKDLENMLADLFRNNGVYLPIYQEIHGQADPDLVALDEEGNLIIFELKRPIFDKQKNFDGQLLRYHSEWKNYSYDELNQKYKKYKGDAAELLNDHKNFFGVSLQKTDFNRAQKLIAVANRVSSNFIDYIKALNKRGDYSVDFLQYRFYMIDNKLLFEFFIKPFDEEFAAGRGYNSPSPAINSASAPIQPALDFKTVNDMIKQYEAAQVASEKLAIKEKILDALSTLKAKAQENRDADAMGKIADCYGKIHDHDSAARCLHFRELFKSK